MCASDTTLEGQAQDNTSRENVGTDGTGGTHVCRDYEELRAWAEGRRLYDVTHL